MADIAKRAGSKPTAVTLNISNDCRVGSGLICGEDIAQGDACYIKSDGKVWRSTGAAANAAAQVDGFAAQDAKVAQSDAVTLYNDVDWDYGSGLTPGTKVFLSATAGAIADAATTGGTGQIGRVIDATRIRLFRSNY